MARHLLYIGLGSNLGERAQLLQQAIAQLNQHVGKVVRTSAFLETAPWGFESEHPFLNAAVAVETALTPARCLWETQAIEKEMGRSLKSNGGAYQDRTIDIDLLMYDDLHLDTLLYTPWGIQRLTLPHPLMEQREFVMKPLKEILP